METVVRSKESEDKSFAGLPVPAMRVKRLVGPDGAVSVNGSMFSVPQFAGRWIYVYLDGDTSDPVQLSPCPTPLHDIIARTKGKRRLFEVACFLTGESPASYPDGADHLEVLGRFQKRLQDETKSLAIWEGWPTEVSEAIVTSPKRYLGKKVRCHPVVCGGSL